MNMDYRDSFSTKCFCSYFIQKDLYYEISDFLLPHTQPVPGSRTLGRNDAFSSGAGGGRPVQASEVGEGHEPWVPLRAVRSVANYLSKVETDK